MEKAFPIYLLNPKEKPMAKAKQKAGKQEDTIPRVEIVKLWVEESKKENGTKEGLITAILRSFKRPDGDRGKVEARVASVATGLKKQGLVLPKLKGG